MIPVLSRSLKKMFSDVDIWLIRCVILASVVAVFYYSGDKAKDTPTQIMLVAIGLAAVGFHLRGAANACKAWYERRAVAFGAWSLIILCAVAWEVNSQLGIASNNQDNLTAIQKSNFTVTEDLEKSESELTAGLKALKGRQKTMSERLNWLQNTAVTKNGQPVVTRSVAQITGDKAFINSDGCKKPATPGQRGVCQEYGAAVEAAQVQADVKALDENITRQEATLADIRAKRGTTKVATSKDRADLKNLKRLTSLSDNDLELGQSLLVILVMSAFLTIAGWLKKAEAYEGQPRKPWGIVAFVKRALHGKGDVDGFGDAGLAATKTVDPATGASVYTTINQLDDSRAIALEHRIRAIGSTIRSATAPYRAAA